MSLRQPLEHGRARLADVLDGAPDDAGSHRRGAGDLVCRAELVYRRRLVEIAAHGSPVVLELLLRRALELGARLAEPGEFTQRAFLAGRLDLTQAEAVRDLIEAQTLTQARQAASQMGGALSRRVQPVKQALVDLIALLEAASTLPRTMWTWRRKPRLRGGLPSYGRRSRRWRPRLPAGASCTTG